MLHLIAKNIITAKLPIERNDVLILFADGVYAFEQLQADYPDVTIYVLRDDMVARGIIDPALPQIDYSTFVDLTTQHHPIVTW